MSKMIDKLDLDDDFVDGYVSDETEAQLTKLFDQEDSFLEGLDETTETNYSCPLCKETFIGRKEIKAHVRRYFKYVCTTCNKRYFRKKYLDIHLKNAHLPSKNVVCPLCQKVFKAVNNLKQHLHLHSEERTFVCDYEGCDKAFKQKPGLQQHIRFKHSANDSFCTRCRKRVLDLESHNEEKHPNRRVKKRKKETEETGAAPKKVRKEVQKNVNEELRSSNDMSATFKFDSDSDSDRIEMPSSSDDENGLVLPSDSSSDSRIEMPSSSEDEDGLVLPSDSSSDSRFEMPSSSEDEKGLLFASDSSSGGDYFESPRDTDLEGGNRFDFYSDSD